MHSSVALEAIAAVTPTAATATASFTATTATAAPTPLAARASFAHVERSAFYVLAVDSGNRGLTFFIV